MKYKFILLILLLASGCTFQVNVLEPQSPTLTIPVTSTSTSLSTPTISIPSSTPLPTQTQVPTDTPTLVPPITTGPSDVSFVVQIVFAPNATYQMVEGNIADKSSQSYSLTALKGQVMSVSVLPDNPDLQGTFQLEITGRDGTVLCPVKDFGCPFWRGALPSNQEYLIKVSAQQGGAYTMRVAINAPGTINQTFTYSDPQGRFSLSYPDDYAPAHYGGAQVTKIPPALTLQYIETQQYTSTNLGEVYFLLGVSDDPEQVSNCTQPLNFDQPETQLGDAMVNGINFTKSQGGGVGAGNIYEQVYYRTVYNGSCYEITYFVHYGNIGNYTPGSVTEFDRTALYQELDEILASLKLK